MVESTRFHEDLFLFLPARLQKLQKTLLLWSLRIVCGLHCEIAVTPSFIPLQGGGGLRVLSPREPLDDNWITDFAESAVLQNNQWAAEIKYWSNPDLFYEEVLSKVIVVLTLDTNKIKP